MEDITTNVYLNTPVNTEYSYILIGNKKFRKDEVINALLKILEEKGCKDYNED